MSVGCLICCISAPADFNPMMRIVTFPPSTGFDEITINIEIFDDEIHEVAEGFLLGATIFAAETNTVDTGNSSPIRNGVALITIFNDDSELLFSGEGS